MLRMYKEKQYYEVHLKIGRKIIQNFQLDGHLGKLKQSVQCHTLLFVVCRGSHCAEREDGK